MVVEVPLSIRNDLNGPGEVVVSGTPMDGREVETVGREFRVTRSSSRDRRGSKIT